MSFTASFDSRDTAPIYLHRFAKYKRRWFILIDVVLLTVSSNVYSVAFSSISYEASTIYDTTLQIIDWLSIIQLIISIPAGLFAIYVIENLGMKSTFISSAIILVIANAIRLISALDVITTTFGVPLLFLGKFWLGVGSCLALVLPTKTAVTWFPDNERAFANSVGAGASSLGIMLTGAIPALYLDKNDHLEIWNLMLSFFCMSVLILVYTLTVVQHGQPAIPPSTGGMQTSQIGVGASIKKLMRNKDYVILMVTVGAAFALYAGYMTMFEQLLCPFGYNSQMTGICSLVLNGAGVLGAIFFGLICDKTKKFSTVQKTTYFFTVVLLVVQSTTLHTYLDYYILFLIGAIGIFSFSLYPIGFELGVECTYPVGAAVSSGLIIVSGQLQSIILTFVMQNVGRRMTSQEVDKFHSECYLNSTMTSPLDHYDMMTSTDDADHTVYDFSAAVYVCTGYIGLLSIPAIFLFKPKYLRRAAEVDDFTGSHTDC